MSAFVVTNEEGVVVGHIEGTFVQFGSNQPKDKEVVEDVKQPNMLIALHYTIKEGEEWTRYPLTERSHFVTDKVTVAMNAPMINGEFVAAIKFSDGTIWDRGIGRWTNDNGSRGNPMPGNLHYEQFEQIAKVVDTSDTKCIIPNPEEKDPMIQISEEQQMFICRFQSIQQILMTLQNDLDRKGYKDCAILVRLAMTGALKSAENNYLYESRQRLSNLLSMSPEEQAEANINVASIPEKQ